MYSFNNVGRFLSTLVCVTLLALSALAVPPTEEALEKWRAEGILDQKIASWSDFKARGGDSPAQHAHLQRESFLAATAVSDEAVDTVHVIVILVDFPDFRYDQAVYNPPAGDPINSSMAAGTDLFDSLLFSVRGVDPVSNPTGSMTDYYLENSYGKMHIQGDVFGWYTAPNNYSFYVGSSDGLNNGSQLAVDAVDLAEAHGADFSLYKTPGSNYCEGVIVVHAGPGAEGGWYGIWSHRSDLGESRTYDNTLITGYTLNPEERFDYGTSNFVMSSMGVFGHEFGHVLGLPDFYDINYNPGSNGLGRFSMMAGGSHNGGGQLPAHFDAYSKFQLGFVDVVFLDSNLANAPIPQVESEPVIYGLREDLGEFGSMEYFLVENRQRVGFDLTLPAGGLCIYHIDNNMISAGNTVPGHYFVGLEQADGEDQLGFQMGNGGDAGDVWPGTTDNRNFHDFSVPSANTFTGLSSHCGVWNISEPDSLMYADLEVMYTRPWVQLYGDSIRFSDVAYGDGDGILEAGETIEMRMEVWNRMATTFRPIWGAVADNADLEFIANNVKIANLALTPAYSVPSVEQVVFTIPSDFRSSLVHFDVTILADSSLNTPGDHTYAFEFEIDVQLGETQILLVDDDGGTEQQAGYADIFGRMKLPYDVYDKSVSGSPSISDLAPYETVFWMTGDNSAKGGTFTSGDVTALQTFLNSGGDRSLVMASLTAADQLNALDQDFLNNYLHAELIDFETATCYEGLASSPIGESVRYTLGNEPGLTGTASLIAPDNGGVDAFVLTDESGGTEYGTCGVTYSGAYHTVFLTFPIEFLDNDASGSGFARADDLIHRMLTFFGRGQTTDVEDRPDGNLLPGDFALHQNYPNPFNPTTTIIYQIGGGPSELTNLAVFNLLGQKVTTLVDKAQGPGTYEVTWDGRDGKGEVASGVYFYRLTRGEINQSRKMMLLK
ncbi:MAG: M6 family metalloprotease domain-containing protein [bacterium]|nr:M6 family metalloprotease domain-containing protein [bacterium]